MSGPHSRSRDQHSVRGHPREVKQTVTPRERKDSDSNDSRKIFIILVLTCSVDSFGFFFPFFPFYPTSVVVVDFIGTVKSN